MFRLFLQFFLLLSILNFSAIAQTLGCYVSTTPATFATVSQGNAGPAGMTARPTYTGSLALMGTTTCPRVKSIGTSRGANTCYIRTGTTSANYTYTSGALYDYTQENCPLDDYIWLMFIIVGGIGFISLKKYQFA